MKRAIYRFPRQSDESASEFTKRIKIIEEFLIRDFGEARVTLLLGTKKAIFLVRRKE